MKEFFLILKDIATGTLPAIAVQLPGVDAEPQTEGGEIMDATTYPYKARIRCICGQEHLVDFFSGKPTACGCGALVYVQSDGRNAWPEVDVADEPHLRIRKCRDERTGM